MRPAGFAIVLWMGLSLLGAPLWAQDVVLEQLLRAQVFNKEFEGFDHYEVVIEDDQRQMDGSREVLVTARGHFLEHMKKLKVLVLLAGDHVIGGQVLEGQGVPPCRAGGSPVQQS